MILLIGLQGAGKTTFYRERFFDTHVRISRDMLRTAERENLLIGACLAAKQAFVLDNTNLLGADRAVHIARAKAAGFRVTGYFFEPVLRASIARNKHRADKKAIPVPAILRSYKRLQAPVYEEGFSELNTVTVAAENRFEVVLMERPKAAVKIDDGQQPQ